MVGAVGVVGVVVVGRIGGVGRMRFGKVVLTRRTVAGGSGSCWDTVVSTSTVEPNADGVEAALVSPVCFRASQVVHVVTHVAVALDSRTRLITKPTELFDCLLHGPC